MASVCLYFQIHQPLRLRRYSVFDTEPDYFDQQRNTLILRKVAEKCYLPATRLMLELIRQHQGRFRIAYSITCCAIEQFKQNCPEMLQLLSELAGTGCVEFLSETSHHSLSFLYSREEFREQVELHARVMNEMFGVRPTVFRNTELVYNNELAQYIAGLGRYRGVLAEGAAHVLAGRPPTFLYWPVGTRGVKLLLKNFRLSDDIAFRFSNRGWSEWPLTADKFAGWVHQINGNGHVCNLFMDYETFGEHQWADTGIFDFLKALPEAIFRVGGSGGGDNDFKTPSECLDTYPAGDEFDAPHAISWADTERDVSAWLGNAMQSNAAHELYRLESRVKATGQPGLIEDWRRLTTSDHFYYMCTKYFADGDVHKYFNPYESPYDSYINFMNVLDNLRTRAETA